MLHWIVVLTLITLLSITKLVFGHLALRGVPPERRAEVIDAVGRAFEKWRWR